MRRTRLLWQLYPSYLLITLLSLLMVVWYGSDALRQSYHERTAADLESRAWLLEEQIGNAMRSPQSDQVDALCSRLGQKTATRITVVLPSGKVLGDSEGVPEEMDNHAERAEIKAALAGRVVPQVRTSRTLGQDMMYVAVPVRRDGKTIGVLRTAMPVTAMDQALRAIQWKIALGGAVVALLAAGVSLFVSRRISRPLERLKRGAQGFAQGNLSDKLPVGDSQEIAALAETLNQMAAELDERIRTVERQRNERDAILSSMVEGVLAVDSRQRLISLNEPGARLFGVDAQTVLGRQLREVVRNPQLHTLVADVLSRGEPIQDDIVLDDVPQRLLRAQGTVLRDSGPGDPKGLETGALVVMHDVTRLKKLENIRRDFVANVSHELKTPITSIKGFVETLLEGAMYDGDNAQRFLRIIASQADRLNEIIEDLLTLSRLEQDTERAGISLQRGAVLEVLQAAVDVCRLKASEKTIAIELACDADLQAEINSALLEQAVVNLVDNAVKYSSEGQTVYVEAQRVEAQRADSEVVIRVRDHGCGIGPEHLPRLFERFYRVDKARSRKLGGTGLGLAIVKHIAQAHGGRATVESTPEEGSVFSLHLHA